MQLLSMYTDPPSEEVTLDDFELMALDRLQVLRRVEDLKVGASQPTSSWRSIFLHLIPMMENHSRGFHYPIRFGPQYKCA